MDLTTRQRVKDWAKGAISGAGLDDLIDRLITDVSAQAEDEMLRVAEIPTSDRSDVFDVEWNGQCRFPLRAWPVTAITDVRYDRDGAFPSGTEIGSGSYVAIENNANNNGILVLRTRLRAGAGSLQVNYRGGMAANTTAFVTAFPQIAGGIDAQVFFLLQRADTLGIESISGEGGSITNLSDTKWLPHVKKILHHHRRRAY